MRNAVRSKHMDSEWYVPQSLSTDVKQMTSTKLLADQRIGLGDNSMISIFIVFKF